eukprot:6231390-Prymnesium_polylepis.1
MVARAGPRRAPRGSLSPSTIQHAIAPKARRLPHLHARSKTHCRKSCASRSADHDRSKAQ